MIVGCNPFGRTVAHLIKSRGEDVVMIDANPEYCKQAKAENLTVYRTSALNMDALDNLGLASIGTFLTATSNSEVNSVLAQRVMEEFRPPRVLAVYPDQSPETEVAEPAEKLASPEVKRAFSSQLSIKEWNQYLSTNEVKITDTVLDIDEHKFKRQRDHLQALISAGTVIPLLVQRQDQLRIAKADEEWQPCDRITYGLHIPKPKFGLAIPNETMQVSS